MALRDGPMWSSAPTGRDALRDGPMCDAKLVLWSQRPLREGAGGDGAGPRPRGGLFCDIAIQEGHDLFAGVGGRV